MANWKFLPNKKKTISEDEESANLRNMSIRKMTFPPNSYLVYSHPLKNSYCLKKSSSHLAVTVIG